jgi:putative ABC transport system substrate-binding protein
MHCSKRHLERGDDILGRPVLLGTLLLRAFMVETCFGRYPHAWSPIGLGALHMRRRDFLALSGSAAIAAPLDAFGQTESRTYRVGLFNFGAPLADASPFAAAMIRGLEKRGYTVGRNLALERRGADGRPDLLPRLLEELVASKVDVIYAVNYRAALVAKNGTTLPVVVVSAGDPVATGLVDSLARPGGHLTGIADLAAELAPKRLQLLTEMSPKLRRVAMLWNAGDPAMTRRYQVSEAAAQKLGVGVEPLPVRSAEDFEPALSANEAKHAGRHVRFRRSAHGTKP